jgi:integrase
MPRPVSGSLKIEHQVDGTLRFRLRFTAHGKRETLRLHEDRDCDCGCGGNWNERTARVELGNILARVQAGIWEPPKRQPFAIEQPFEGVPTFHEYVSYWLKAKIEGIIGEKPISKNTTADYRSRIRHLISFFGPYRLNEIDAELCLAFKKHKIKEAHEITEALAAGADLRDHRNRKVEPLSPSSIKKLITLLASICDEAFEDKLMSANPARGKRLKIHVPKPKRTFLEMDELVAVEDAAGEQDPSLERFARAAREASAGSSAAAVAVRLAEGKRQKQIGAELGLSKGAIFFHVRNLGGLRVGKYVGRKAILATLGKSGVRNSELCDIRIGHLRLHDPEGARFRIPDSKTETGIRIVEVSPDLAEVLILHIDRLRRAGNDTSPDAYLFQNERGGRMSRQRIGEIVREAATQADQKLRNRGLPPLPHITPHSLRRTYISISLVANEYDIKWVMEQVGHADSHMTLDVYNQLQQRAKRDHGRSFDRLIRQARQELYRGDAEPTHNGRVLDHELDHGRKTSPKTPRSRHSGNAQKPTISREKAVKPQA